MNKIIISTLIVLIIIFYLCKLSFLERFTNFNELNYDAEMNLYNYQNRRKFDDNLYYPLVNPKIKLDLIPEPFDKIKCWDNLYLPYNTNVGWSKKRYKKRKYRDFTRECNLIKKYGVSDNNNLKQKSEKIIEKLNPGISYWNKYFGGIKATSYYNRKYWNGNFYNDPEKLMNGCCKYWKDIYNDVAKMPCLQKTEMSRYCDFYSNHIYRNNRWQKINRSKGERSECDRVPILKTVCCHSCSI